MHTFCVIRHPLCGQRALLKGFALWNFPCGNSSWNTLSGLSAVSSLGSGRWQLVLERCRVEVLVVQNPVIPISKALLSCFSYLRIWGCLIALAAKQLSHCTPGRAAFLRLTRIHLSHVFPFSVIKCSDDWLYFQDMCLLICLLTDIGVWAYPFFSVVLLSCGRTVSTLISLEFTASPLTSLCRALSFISRASFALVLIVCVYYCYYFLSPSHSSAK